MEEMSVAVAVAVAARRCSQPQPQPRWMNWGRWEPRPRKKVPAQPMIGGGDCAARVMPGTWQMTAPALVRAARSIRAPEWYEHYGLSARGPWCYATPALSRQPCSFGSLSLSPSFRAVLDGGSECSEFNNGHAFFIRSRQSTSLLSPPLKTLTISSFPASSLSLFGILAVVSACCDFTPL